MAVPLRILLITGSEDGSALVLDALRGGGYDPSWLGVDTEPALERVLSLEWEVALADLGSAGAAGRRALALLRDRRPEVPIVVLVRDAGDDGAVAADAVVTPDQLPAGLSSAVARVLREAETRRTKRRADEALRDSGGRFAQAFAYAPIGMAIVGIDGIVLQANRALGEMFGYAASEMAGLPVWRLTHPDDMALTIEQLQRLVEGESDAWYLEKRYFHRDGRTLWGRSSTWLVRGDDGVARYVVSQVQDITASRALEERMRRQQEELAHALRLASMGETVAGIAHEINQPLAAIANYAHGLVRRPDDVERTRAAAARIAGEALRAGEVIRRLRAFLRKGEARRERCDVAELVRDSVRLLDPEIRRHAIALSLETTEKPQPVEIHRGQVAQVVLSMVQNSIEALARTTRDGRRLVVSTAAATAEVVVSVRDSGIGLPGDAGDKIFDPFFTTKEEGLGLGLAISRSIIEAHWGRLWALPNADGGATVAFSLPIHAPRA